MSDVLARICETKREHIATRKRERPISEIEKAAHEAGPTRPFLAALRNASVTGYGLLAEIKKASPSKGLIRADFDPTVLARAYAVGGATCISVLTAAPYFQGHDDYLIAARSAVNLPILRKDFMLDAYQVNEARALGADCILLIMAVLDDMLATELEAQAMELAMDVLIEVHDETELERALQLRSPLLGVNNRNLKTMTTNLGTTKRLANHVPDDRVLVSESGFKTAADLAAIARTGTRCFLIGESLMCQDDVTIATRTILARPPHMIAEPSKS